MSEAENSAGGRGASEGRGGEPRPAPEWFLGAMKPVIFALSRALWRISFRGEENVPAPSEGGLIVAANHQTYVDPFWVGSRVRRPLRFLAWNEAFKWPLAGKALELLGAWPISFERGSHNAHRRALKWLREGGAVMIFPEGQRAYADGSPSRFKAGAVRLALEAGASILPVTIRGGEHVWPRGQSLPRFGRVEVVFHPVRRPTVPPGEDARQVVQRETEALAEIIKSAL